MSTKTLPSFCRAVIATAGLAMLAAGHTLLRAQGIDETPRGDDQESAGIEQEALDYLFGVRVPADEADVVRLFEQAAASGRHMAQYHLAKFLWDGVRVPEDRARSVELFEAAARQGNAGAQAFLGWAYVSGESVARDPARAHQWFSAAMRQGDAYATWMLARMYVAADGVARDLERAHDLALRAAELGNPDARFSAGMSLMHGPPSRRDVRKGMYLLEKGALGNNAYAQYALGLEHLSGRNAARDLVLAAQWIGRAADADHRLAALRLSELYAKGLGVERDDDRAAAVRAAALEKASPSEVNAFAWELATSEDPALRNGQVAVDLMEDMLRNPEHHKAAYLDTLAAAYAETGQFDAAVAAQRDAIALLPAPVPEDFRARLALYEAREAYRVEL